MNDSEIFHQDPLWEEGGDLPGALEALLTAAGEVLDLPRLRELTGLADGALQQGLEKLQARLQGASGLRLLEVGGGWRMATSPVYKDMVSKLVTTTRSGKLTPAQIEALAIVAYRQPVTRAAIERVRGVDSDYTVRALLHRRLIAEQGRSEAPGRPILYGTGFEFLERFGLASLDDLPPLDLEVAARLVDGDASDAALAADAAALSLAAAAAAVTPDPADGEEG